MSAASAKNLMSGLKANLDSFLKQNEMAIVRRMELGKRSSKDQHLKMSIQNVHPFDIPDYFNIISILYNLVKQNKM